MNVAGIEPYAAGRPWDNPVIGRDLRGRARGGWLAIVVTVALVLQVGAFAILAFYYVTEGDPDAPQFGPAAYALCTAVRTAFAILTAVWLGTGALDPHRRRDAFDQLVTSGVPPHRVLLGKLAMAAGGVLAVFISGLPVAGVCATFGDLSTGTIVATEAVCLSYALLAAVVVVVASIWLLEPLVGLAVVLGVFLTGMVSIPGLVEDDFHTGAQLLSPASQLLRTAMETAEFADELLDPVIAGNSLSSAAVPATILYAALCLVLLPLVFTGPCGRLLRGGGDFEAGPTGLLRRLVRIPSWINLSVRRNQVLFFYRNMEGSLRRRADHLRELAITGLCVVLVTLTAVLFWPERSWDWTEATGARWFGREQLGVLVIGTWLLSVLMATAAGRMTDRTAWLNRRHPQRIHVLLRLAVPALVIMALWVQAPEHTGPVAMHTDMGAGLLLGAAMGLVQFVLISVAAMAGLGTGRREFVAIALLILMTLLPLSPVFLFFAGLAPEEWLPLVNLSPWTAVPEMFSGEPETWRMRPGVDAPPTATVLVPMRPWVAAWSWVGLAVALGVVHRLLMGMTARRVRRREEARRLGVRSTTGNSAPAGPGPRATALILAAVVLVGAGVAAPRSASAQSPDGPGGPTLEVEAALGGVLPVLPDRGRNTAGELLVTVRSERALSGTIRVRMNDRERSWPVDLEPGEPHRLRVPVVGQGAPSVRWVGDDGSTVSFGGVGFASMVQPTVVVGLRPPRGRLALPDGGSLPTLTPDGLPRDPWLWQAIGCVILWDAGPDDLDPAQLEALRWWVADGGRLVLPDGGAGWTEFDPADRRVPPAPAPGDRDLAWVDRALAPVPHPEGRIAVRDLSRVAEPDSTAWMAADGLPLVLDLRRGRGTVTLMALDPTTPGFRPWYTLPDLWAFLDGTGTRPWPREFLANNHRAATDEDMVEGAYAPLVFVCSALVAWLLLVGPGLWLVMRLRNRPVAYWPALPLVCVGGLLLVPVVNARLSSWDGIAARMDVVDLAASDDGHLAVSHMLQLRSLGAETFGLSCDGLTGSAVQLDEAGGWWRPARLVDGPHWIGAEADEAAVIRAGTWSQTAVHMRGRARRPSGPADPLPPDAGIQVRRAGAGAPMGDMVEYEITNNTGLPITDVCVIRPEDGLDMPYFSTGRERIRPGGTRVLMLGRNEAFLGMDAPFSPIQDLLREGALLGAHWFGATDRLLVLARVDSNAFDAAGLGLDVTGAEVRRTDTIIVDRVPLPVDRELHASEIRAVWMGSFQDPQFGVMHRWRFRLPAGTDPDRITRMAVVPALESPTYTASYHEFTGPTTTAPVAPDRNWSTSAYGHLWNPWRFNSGDMEHTIQGADPATVRDHPVTLGNLDPVHLTLDVAVQEASIGGRGTAPLLRVHLRD